MNLISETQIHTGVGVERHPASEAGGWSNQYLLTGDGDALLYDVPQLRSDALKLADAVETSQSTLRYVWISHAHPDHFLGLDVIADRFPDAEIVSTENVVADLQRDGPWMFDLVKTKLGPEAAERLVEPAVYRDDWITLGDSTLNVVEFGPGEAKHHACLHLPDNGAFITSDIVYHGAHLYLQEHNAEGWRARLDELERYLVEHRVETIHPGHGPAGDRSLLAVTRAYLDAFASAVELGDADRAAAELLARYPEYHAPQFLTMFSLPAYLPAAKG